ncbi:MAG: hypothetical protein SGI74_11680 [Oligoflexia bacterium]|nr:hypothetical protein [Oligoflexia bacterium]
MERLYRVVFLALFIIGFVGAAASSSQSGLGSDESALVSMIKDVRLAQEANEINEGRWNQNVQSLNEDSLARVEAVFAHDSSVTTVQK